MCIFLLTNKSKLLCVHRCLCSYFWCLQHQTLVNCIIILCPLCHPWHTSTVSVILCISIGISFEWLLNWVISQIRPLSIFSIVISDVCFPYFPSHVMCCWYQWYLWMVDWPERQTVVMLSVTGKKRLSDRKTVTRVVLITVNCIVVLHEVLTVQYCSCLFEAPCRSLVL